MLSVAVFTVDRNCLLDHIHLQRRICAMNHKPNYCMCDQNISEPDMNMISLLLILQEIFSSEEAYLEKMRMLNEVYTCMYMYSVIRTHCGVM